MLIRTNVDKCLQTTTDVCGFYNITILKKTQQIIIFVHHRHTTIYAGRGEIGNGLAQGIFFMMDSGARGSLALSCVLIRHSSSVA